MKSRNLFLGIIILFIGVVSLLVSLDVINFSWHILWRFWPMVLIFIGVAILPLKDWLKAILLLVALAIGVLLYQNEVKKEADCPRSGWVSSARHWWNWIDDMDFD